MLTPRVHLLLRVALLVTAVAPLAAQDARRDSVASLGDLPRRDRVAALNDQSIMADLAAFDLRAKGRKGVFLGPDELDRRDPLLFQDILAGRGDLIAVGRDNALRMRTLTTRTPMVNEEPARGSSVAGSVGAVAIRGTEARRASEQREAFCTPDVFVDNLWLSRGGAPVLLTQLDAQWSAPAVVAVEIYESPWQIPDAFGPVMRGGSCGLVAFWTSRRSSADPAGGRAAP